MRYIGGAPGHITTRETSRFLGRLSHAYSQEFADRRAQELADLGYMQDDGGQEMEVDEHVPDNYDSGPDEGAEDRSDDSDFVQSLDGEEDDDFAYGWAYPRDQERVRNDLEEEDDGEIQAFGYDAD